MMKKAVLGIALLFLSAASAVAASTADFANQGGTLTGSSAGLAMTGSVLIGITTTSTVTGDLGTVSFTTGSLAIGNLQHGAVFNSGGSFSIIGNSTNPVHVGTIFSGTFSGPVVWSVITLANGTHNYSLTGTLSGTWFTDVKVQGITVQLTINTGKGFFNGQTTVSSGNTDFTVGGSKGVVPEPSSFLYLGTGLISVAGMLRRKFLS